MRKYTVQIGNVTLPKIEELLAWVNQNGGILESLNEQPVNGSERKKSFSRKVLPNDEIKSIIVKLNKHHDTAAMKEYATEFGVSAQTINRIYCREGRYRDFK